MKKLLLIILLLFVSAPAIASERTKVALVSTGGQKCKMVETVTVGMNFNVQGIELGEAKSLMENKMAEIENIATSLEISNMELQNYSYNIYANSTGCGHGASNNLYQFNGNLSFKLDSADKTDALMDALAEKGFNVNFNMNAYRQCQ
tara:strand:+ start:507 stop:947 length:441 start_codon:yes stop_codon:yes gene_type:complete